MFVSTNIRIFFSVSNFVYQGLYILLIRDSQGFGSPDQSGLCFANRLRRCILHNDFSIVLLEEQEFISDL